MKKKNSFINGGDTVFGNEKDGAFHGYVPRL